MGFRKGGAGKRRDAIEPDVIQALRAIGCEVYQINGRALPDLLCRHRGHWLPLGVKSGEKARLTASERSEPPSWPIVRSVDQAVAIMQLAPREAPMIADALQRLRDHWRQRFTALTSDGEVMRDDLVKARMLRDCITDLNAALAALQGAGQDQYAGLAQDRASASIKPKDGQGSAAHPASNSAAGEARVPHEPPAHIVQFAIEASTSSPCRSKRGVVIFRGADLVSQGYNYKPRGFDCDGSDACKATCRDEAIHAEQQALLLVGRKAEGCDLLHVKTVGGMLVPSGPPSCVQCSKLALVTGILGVWLFRGEDGWVRYPIAEFHRLSLAAQEARPAPPLDWQRITEFKERAERLLAKSNDWAPIEDLLREICAWLPDPPAAVPPPVELGRSVTEG